jgi:hypothetical protein
MRNGYNGMVKWKEHTEEKLRRASGWNWKQGGLEDYPEKCVWCRYRRISRKYLARNRKERLWEETWDRKREAVSQKEKTKKEKPVGHLRHGATLLLKPILLWKKKVLREYNSSSEANSYWLSYSQNFPQFVEQHNQISFHMTMTAQPSRYKLSKNTSTLTSQRTNFIHVS